MQHKSVLLKEVISYLNPKAGEVYVDATFGAGGYSKKILETDGVTVVAFDQDPDVQSIADETKELYKDRFHFVADNFENIKEQVRKLGFEKINGVVFDLGVSSMQLDRADRGFSFAKDADLDMRMSKEGLSAKEIINSYREEQIADIIYRYGEEKLSRKIARLIVAEREQQEISTTSQLTKIIHKVRPPRFSDKIDPATKTFQAIRIFVNDELRVLQDALDSLVSLLAHNARLVAVSFHSLEDRIVKQFLTRNSNKTSSSVSRYFPDDKNKDQSQSFFEILTKKPIVPTLTETDQNVRARSAKLRAAMWYDIGLEVSHA